MSRRTRSIILLAAACVGVGSLNSPGTQAAVATFDNGGGDGGLWSNNVNWNPDGAVAGLCNDDGRVNGRRQSVNHLNNDTV